ncbi:hypothetical protein J7E97_10335 [Streptomyces sp. ISL-66]|uniref:hypothetical protein n=1 Tax=Streptomyces sp. ISL-66 TaxID=2819186 RepID=UPI001BE67765|nr:hypothetical protein [Streptomyces sp. ISL-66]MBT2468264.1 hypothetical protein [Streptomyces sp. ISL-66]
MATPAQVAGALTASASPGAVLDAGPGSPDRALYVGSAPNRAPGKRFANTTDLPVGDLGTVESPVTVSGVPGRAPAQLDVELYVKHPASGELRIGLIAPDGSVYAVKDEYTGWGQSDLVGLYAVDASSETAAGAHRRPAGARSAPPPRAEPVRRPGPCPRRPCPPCGRRPP